MLPIMRWCFLCLLLLASPALACGPDSDCPLGERVYRIYTPPEIKHPGAIVFAHGYRGSAAGIMRSDGFRALADRIGVPLVAAQSYADDWRIPGVPADPGTDGGVEYSYFTALRARLAEAHGIDPAKALFTGFSAGGMMVWQLACFQGETFGAYAPIAGTFWQKMPETCPSAPVSLIHIHGTSDRIVPLAGRPIGPAAHQGDVREALALLTRAGSFPDRSAHAAADLTCESATAPSGEILDVCTHPGGHSLRAAYVAYAWSRLRNAGRF